MNDRLPPQNLDAERSVLGSMLRWNDCIDDVLVLLRKESFYASGHQDVFAAIAELRGSGKVADLVTVAEVLSKSQIENLGGYGRFAELWDFVPTAANVLHYARI